MKFAWLSFTFLSLDNRFQFMTSQLHKLALFSWNEWKEYHLYKIFIWFPQGSIFPKKWDFPSKNTGVGKCGVGENSWESLGLQGDQTSQS